MQATMPERQGRREKVYAAVVESMKQEGFCGVTPADVADAHNKLKQSVGFGAPDQAGQSMIRLLLEHLQAMNDAVLD